MNNGYSYTVKSNGAKSEFEIPWQGESQEVGRSRAILRNPRRVRPFSPRPVRRPQRRFPRRPWSARYYRDTVFTEPAPGSDGSEYMRWVQTMLNQVLNLQLPVDGISSVQTRSAIRSFQEKNGLPVTGVVGPDTERALMSAGRVQSPAASPAQPDEPSATPTEPAAATPATEFEFEWETGFKTGLAEQAWETGFEVGGPAGPAAPALCAGLAPIALNDAVRANRILARQLGWGCVVGGQVNAIPEVITALGVPATPREDQLACAIADWQQRQRVGADGKLGPRTWGAMLHNGLLPRLRFKPASWNVYWGGKKLGILEKTSPYLTINDGHRGGASIQLAFRVTDMEEVRKAGFVNAAGEVNFRWIQAIETNRPLQDGPPVHLIRKYRRYIDPNADLRDNHPYYWDEEGQGDPRYRIGRYSSRPAANRLCYDLIFEDGSRRPLSEASTGHRVYWNAETALVGVRSGGSNVILNTVLWGFDLVIEGGVPVVKLNALRAGPVGGSTAFRQVLSRAIQAGSFAGHCFVGTGFTGTARCR